MGHGNKDITTRTTSGYVRNNSNIKTGKINCRITSEKIQNVSLALLLTAYGLPLSLSRGTVEEHGH